MIVSPEGRKLVEQFEGYSSTAYKDQRGIFTIGWGHTLGVKAGDTCTSAEADRWMSHDLALAESAINRLVTHPLTQNMFDALVSLTYNIGVGAFSLSSVLKSLNAGHLQSAANAILLWNKTNGQVNPGLQNRREAEKALFLKP